jgi:hypothetical protein
MQVDYLENEGFPIGLLEQGSLDGIAALVKELLTRAPVHEQKQDRLSYWQRIFLQSKVNGGFQRAEDLPQGNWEWPKSTCFQERLSRLRDLEFVAQQGRN